MLFARLACATFYLVLGFAIADAQSLDKVAFATNWVAQGEHGGFYQALADGTYRKYGLDVTIVQGGVHLSRPKNWMIREASNDPGRAYIQYISPKAYSFAIYERPDAPTELWKDVLNRYEDDVSSVGAKVVGKRVPVATAIGQGRAYTIERTVDAAKRPFVSHSREVVLRGDHRIVIVQIVQQAENLSAVEDELLRVIGTLEVL